MQKVMKCGYWGQGNRKRRKDNIGESQKLWNAEIDGKENKRKGNAARKETKKKIIKHENTKIKW